MSKSPSWRQRFGLTEEPPDPLARITDPVTGEQQAFAYQDRDNHTVSRDLWYNWLYCAYAHNDEAADRARDTLIEQINKHHNDARKIVSRALRNRRG